VLVFIGTNPYENQSVFFMQYCVGKEIIVIDPRKTATVQYAEQTGGLHVRPKRLGADPLVLYAIARKIIRRWIAEKSGNSVDNFPLRDGVVRTLQQITDFKEQAKHEPKEKQQYEMKRRASRAMTFEQFADFLQVDNPASPYTLNNAARTAGINPPDLSELVRRIWDQREFTKPPDPTPPNGDPPLNNEPPPTETRRPRVGIMYEKGLLWGFNYHNTAAIGSLGLLLGAYDEDKRGQFVGRVGGHQKGWAESKADLKDCFDNTDSRDPSSYTEGYPFRNVTDKYSDQHLKECFGEVAQIKVHHNLDNHVFGPPPDFHHLDQKDVPEGKVRLKNNLIAGREPDVRLLWIIGNNYLGQTNDGQRKRTVLERRLRVGGTINGVRRPRTADVDEIVEALGARIDACGLVCVHQELFASPTTELCDLVIPAAGWGEDVFCRYNAQRRLKLYDRFQDMPIHVADRCLEVWNYGEDPMQQIDRDAEEDRISRADFPHDLEGKVS
jgi:anaerobic selenocysteine-containing dehydrogenase